jgi:hypothetical protein
MDKNLIKKLVESLNSSINKKGSYAVFSDNGYKSVRLDKKNFHIVNKIQSNNKIAFIDGGNAEILGASNFSLQLIRIYYTIYKSNKRIQSKKKEFYLLITAENNKDKIEYKIETFGDAEFKDLKFNSEDETLKQGINRANINKIGDVIRRFTELRTASGLVEGLENNDIIVIDGDLKSSFKDEDKYINRLFEAAKTKKIIISALAKTSRLFTDTGDSLITTLEEIAPEGYWYYYPVVEISDDKHKADIFIVKLHEKSNYIFKLEVYKNVQYDIDKILPIIKNNSTDPVFLGYPYGLIEADRFARVSNEEKEYLRTIIIAKIGKNCNKISKYLNTLNAHDILDNIR